MLRPMTTPCPGISQQQNKVQLTATTSRRALNSFRDLSINHKHRPSAPKMGLTNIRSQTKVSGDTNSRGTG